MRTTLTLDDDVAAALGRIRESRDVTFKELVNEVLREGLQQRQAKHRPKKLFRTKVWDSGGLLVPSLDNIAEVLALIEGEAHR